MRLWTFQYDECINTLLKNSIYREKPGHEQWKKEIDKAHFDLVDGNYYAPIYCFARVAGQKSLSLRTLIQFYSHLNGYYQLDLWEYGRALIELDVPDELIRNVKFTACHKDGDGNIEYIDKLGFVRSKADDIEAVITFILSKWVVAIHKFDCSTDKVKCITVYKSDKHIPAWTEDVVFDSCRSYDLVDGKRRQLSGESEKEFYNTYSMKGVPLYFTVAEALDCCEINTKNAILLMADKKKYDKSCFNRLTIKRLFEGSI